VLLGLALFLSMVVMQPVAVEMYHQGWEPMEAGKMTTAQAIEAGSKPLHNFLVRFRAAKKTSNCWWRSLTPPPTHPCRLGDAHPHPGLYSFGVEDRLSDRSRALLPFLVIDLVIASVTLSIGMVQLPPVMISAPFKILLFVLVDGWNLVVGSLMKSFYI